MILSEGVVTVEQKNNQKGPEIHNGGEEERMAKLHRRAAWVMGKCTQ